MRKAGVVKKTERRLFTVEQLSRNVHAINFDNVKAGWEAWGLLRSDAHHDNEHNDWAFEKSHLEQAKARNAFIIDSGDAYDLMQGKYDPRSDLSALKDEHKGTDYLDSVVRTAARDYSPYAANFAIMGMGNHETNILNRLGTNVTDRLAHELNESLDKRKINHHVYASGYSGWALLRFTLNKTQRQSIALHYFHGSGGGGPVTRDVIKTNRMAVYLPDADIVMSGHTHDNWVVPIARVRISKQSGVVTKDYQYHVKTGTYKDEYADGNGGWAVEKGLPPKPLGAVWMRLFVEPSHEQRIGVEFTPALKTFSS